MLIKKQCTKCNRFKGFPCFDKQGKYLNPRCKLCRSQDAKNRRAAGKVAPPKPLTEQQKARKKEYAKSYMPEYRRRNKVKLSEQKKRWNEANIEHCKAYYLLNIEKIRINNSRWQQDNPEKNRARVHRYNARKLAQFVEDVVDTEVFARDNWTCGLCGHVVDSSLKHPEPMAAQLDHIVPLSVGGEHSYANTQCSHALCNQRKNKRCSDGLPTR